MVCAGAMQCFQPSCMSACMTRRELCGRWMEIWPAMSGSKSDERLAMLEESKLGGRMRRTRNSRVTPREREPITARGPR